MLKYVMDKDRIYPVDSLVLHHSLGPEFKDTDSLIIQDWFDSCGRGWGYEHYRKENNIKPEDLRSGHMHPARDKETFSQVQFALRQFHGEWNLVLLMRDPYNCTAMHLRKPEIDRRSIGVEVCGDYSKKALPEAALHVLVCGFIDHAKALYRDGKKFEIFGHRDFWPVSCPGMIYKQIPELQNMFLKKLGMI